MAKIRKVSNKQKKINAHRRAQKMLARERDKWRCRDCGKYLGNGGGEVHHVIKLSHEVNDDLSNLIFLCGPWGCNAHNRAHRLHKPHLYIQWDGEDFILGLEPHEP